MRYDIDNNKKTEKVAGVMAYLYKHKNKIYAAILVVVGFLGGNIDRLETIMEALIPKPTVEYIERIEKLETNQADIQNKLDSINETVEKLKKFL